MSSVLKWAISLILCVCLNPIASAASPKPVPPDDAFQFSVSPTRTDSIITQWKIAPGYYLYRDRFSFEVSSPAAAAIGFIIKPQGIEKKDDILGGYFVYENQVALSVPILNPTPNPLKLLVHYQGCATWGFCYPPMTKLVTIASRQHLSTSDISISNYEFSNRLSLLTPSIPVSSQDRATEILAGKSMSLALLIFFGFGLLLAFTPCVLPMIPILSGIIVGQGDNISTRHAFRLSLSYVLGMALAFAIAGVVVGLIGSSLQAALQAPWILILFSLLFVILAFSLFGFYDLKLSQAWQQKINSLSRKQRPGSYLGVAIMGALSTLIVSPCVSAPLVGALAYISNTGNAVLGGLALFVMALGMGLPLLIIGTSFGSLLPRAGTWMNSIKNFFGVVMLGVAIWMLERVLPGSIILMLWGLLTIVTAVFIGALGTMHASWFSRLKKGLGLALFIYGVLLLIGAAMGNSDVLQPLKLHPSTKTAAGPVFQRVKTIADLETALKNAKGRFVMLDFYADWCVACKEMEVNTFSNPKVVPVLNNFVLLRADVTANDAADKALEKNFSVVAPPAILFFDKNGNEIPSAGIVGEMNAAEFLLHLNLILQE